MLSPRTEFLAALKTRLHTFFEPGELVVRLAEADAHLRDGIEIRVELGLDLASAEREAVATFGDVERVSRAIVRESQARGVSVRLQILGRVYASLVVLSFVSYRLLEVSVWTALLPFLVIAAGAIGLAFTSFRARHSAPIPLAVVGVAATTTLWLAVGATTLNLFHYGGHGSVPRWEAASLVRKDQAWLAGRPPAPNDAWSYAPYAEDRLSDDMQAIPKAQADPVGNLLSESSLILRPSAEVACFAVLIDLAFAGLGSAAARRRKSVHLA